jgi:hypothetical protein
MWEILNEEDKKKDWKLEVIKILKGNLKRELTIDECNMINQLITQLYMKSISKPNKNFDECINEIYFRLWSKLAGTDHILGLEGFDFPAMYNLIYNMCNELALWEITFNNVKCIYNIDRKDDGDGRI